MLATAVTGFALIAAVFFTLERVRPHRREQKILRRGWLNDVCYVVLNGLLIAALLGTIVAALYEAAHALVPEAWRASVASWPLVLQVAAALVLGDLGFYVAHRAFHRVPVLWRFHAIHHGIEELDWLAGHRVHVVDQVLTKSASFLPVAFLGVTPAAVAIWATIYAWHSVLLHSNVRISFGPLATWIASPHFHRWHHAIEPEARDRNFAGQFALIDRALGTAYAPDGVDPRGYGVDESLPRHWLAQFVHPAVPSGR